MNTTYVTTSNGTIALLLAIGAGAGSLITWLIKDRQIDKQTIKELQNKDQTK